MAPPSSIGVLRYIPHGYGEPMSINDTLKDVYSTIARKRILSSDDISATETVDGTLLSLANPAPQGGGGGGGSSYDGPFSAVALTSSSILIQGYNTGSTPPRNWQNLITLGETTITFPETTVGSVSSSGYIYLDIKHSSSYTVTALFGVSIPAQTDTDYYIPIAWIDYASSKITDVIQEQYGQIHGVGGRVF